MTVNARPEASTAIKRGETLISVEADDTAGEDGAQSDGERYSDEEDNEETSNSSRPDIFDSDEDEEGAPQCSRFQLTLPHLEANEIEELQSDREYEDNIGSYNPE